MNPIRRTFKTKNVNYKGKEIRLNTNSYSVLASFVDATGKTMMGIGKYPTDAIKDLERRMKKK